MRGTVMTRRVVTGAAAASGRSCAMTEVWILGGTGRSGRAIAAELLRRGIRPVLVGRDAGGLEETAGGLEETAGGLDGAAGRLGEAPGAPGAKAGGLRTVVAGSVAATADAI